jgi:hypothetical protein
MIMDKEDQDFLLAVYNLFLNILQGSIAEKRFKKGLEILISP